MCITPWGLTFEGITRRIFCISNLGAYIRVYLYTEVLIFGILRYVIRASVCAPM